MRHTCAVFLAWFMPAVVLAQAEIPAAAGTPLETQRTCSLAKSWNDKGSGADLDGFFYVPVVSSSEFIIGGYGSRQKKLTDEDCVLTVGESAPLVTPIAWELIWLDKGTGARKDGSMWRAIPPNDDYRCIGSIPQVDYDKPDLFTYRCVPAALTEKVITSALIWNDKGSGAKKPVSIFKLPNSGSFVAVPGRLAQIEAYDLKLSPVTTVTAETEQPALEVTAMQPEKAQPITVAGPLPAPPASAAAESPTSAAVERAVPAGEPDFPGQALALRQLMVDRADTAVQVLRLIPGVSWLLPQTVQEDKRDSVLKQIWGPFFENVIVEINGVDTPTPSALYYNPLLDVALLTRWERYTKLAYRLSGLQVVPGERISAASATVPAAPDWMTGDAPIDTLYNTTIERLAAFRRDGAAEYTGTTDQRYEWAVQNLQAAQPRLEWNTSQRAGWHGETNVWLSATIGTIEESFSLGDAAALIARAAQTDVETADALVKLPTGLVDRLTLDMVLNYGEEERLLVISLPDDGDFYIMVQCRLDTGAVLCAPGQYTLVGLEIDAVDLRRVTAKSSTAATEQVAPPAEATSADTGLRSVAEEQPVEMPSPTVGEMAKAPDGPSLSSKALALLKQMDAETIKEVLSAVGVTGDRDEDNSEPAVALDTETPKSETEYEQVAEHPAADANESVSGGSSAAQDSVGSSGGQPRTGQQAPQKQSAGAETLASQGASETPREEADSPAGESDGMEQAQQLAQAPADLQCDFSNYKEFVFNPEKMQQLRAQGKTCQLGGLEFDDEDFRGADLVGINFQGSLFWIVNFEGEDLSDANMKGITCMESNFNNTTLNQETDFTDAKLFDCKFRDANMREAIFKRTSFSGVEMHGADVTGANFEDVLVSSSDKMGKI